MEQKRVDKVNYYLDIADAVLERSTCLRRHYGAILVRNDEIISTGYNGAPRGRQNLSLLHILVKCSLGASLASSSYTAKTEAGGVSLEPRP